MSNGWSADNIATSGKIVTGVQANAPVTSEARVSSGGALNGIIKLRVSAVTQVGTITPKLQTGSGSDWVDVKSGTAISATGIQYIRWNIEVAADQTVLPLLSKLRLVVTTTNAGDSVAFDLVEVLQEL